jgi:uncharacterized protein
MQCPQCAVALVMSERQGVEIDYCPQCRGVWLDRGELDKILERSALEAQGTYGARPPQQPQAPYAPPQGGYPPPQGGYRQPPQQYERRDRDDDDHYDPRYQGKKRKRGFLDDLFDFD